MSDTIDRQAALDALGERPVVWSDNDDYTLGERNQYDMDRLAIETVPSSQPDVPDTNVGDMISRQAAIDTFLTELTKRERKNFLHTWSTVEVKYFVADMLEKLPSAQQTALTADDIETIRIHLSAFKETLCNQGRWTEAEEYERLIQRLTGKGGQDEENTVR